MVFSFNDVRGGFGYGGSMDMNSMRNRRAYNSRTGDSYSIPDSTPISLNFAFEPADTWYADNRSFDHGTIYANNSFTVRSSGYNRGYVQVRVYIRVSANYRVNGRLVNINRNGVTQVGIDDYFDKDLGVTESYGPYNISCNRGDSIQIYQARGGINNVRMTATYYPSP
jgi:hypothetical protein